MIEYRGTMHIVAMDKKTIQEIAHSLVVTGKTKLALEFLINSAFDKENAHAFIESIANEMLQKLKPQQPEEEVEIDRP
jgi:hypothetical protein